MWNEGAQRMKNTRSSRPAAGKGAPAVRKKAGQRPAVSRKRRKKKAAFRPFSQLHGWLNRYRTTPVRTMVVNSLVAMVALIILIAILGACWPGIRMARLKKMVAGGEINAAVEELNGAEKDGADESTVQTLRQKLASRMLAGGRMDDALALLALTAADDAETARLTAEARYQKAEALYAEGDYEEASRLFYRLSGMGDAASRYVDCVCALAIEAYLDGDTPGAHRLLTSVDGAEEHIRRAALDVTGSENEANALLSGDALNPESIRKLKLDSQAVLEAQKSLQGGRIAAGSRHTVGLQSDGTVVAVGDNTYGQTDVSSWSGVIQVAAGARHTVGLKSDGTVFATGDNSKGQLNVSDWTNIKMIACSDYDTLGLKNDGTVVTTGLHGYSDVADWHNVTSISGGSYSAACLYGQGMMLSTHKGAQMKTGVLLSQLSVCGPCAAGVQPDGTLVCSWDGAPVWTEIAHVETSTTGILAVTNTGEIRTHFFRASDDPGIQLNGKAVEIASSGTHHVILLEDGRVQAFGLNDAGQLNVNDWQL